MSTARAEHFVLGGSWDYHALPMNSPPEVVTMIEMALIAKTSKYLVGLSGLGAKLSKLRVYAEKVKGWLNENWGSKLSGQKKDVDRARTESDSRPFQGREFSEEAEEAEKKIKELKDGLNDVEREMKERIKEDKKKIEDLEKLIVDLKQKWVEADDSVRISLQAQLQSCEADKKRAACRAAAIAWADQMVRQNAEFYSSQIQAATEEIEKIKDHMVDIAKEYTPDDQDP